MDGRNLSEYDCKVVPRTPAAFTLHAKLPKAAVEVQ